MTTGGEGGMVTTQDEKYWEAIWSYKDHGKSWSSVYDKEELSGFRWVHDTIGINGRLPEMQSAIGRIQLVMMPKWISARRANGLRILNTAATLSALRVAYPPITVGHAWYRAYVFVRPEALKTGWTRDRIIQAMNDNGVPCSQGSCSEVYLEKCFTSAGISPATRLPAAQELGETSLMFLVHPTLTEDEISKTCDTLVRVVQQATLENVA